MLFDRDPDGGMTYTEEDQAIIAAEDEAERKELIRQIGSAYDDLINF